MLAHPSSVSGSFLPIDAGGFLLLMANRWRRNLMRLYFICYDFEKHFRNRSRKLHFENL
jgi:hypothetical protein